MRKNGDAPITRCVPVARKPPSVLADSQQNVAPTPPVLPGSLAADALVVNTNKIS